jgi:hypothetical protein
MVGNVVALLAMAAKYQELASVAADFAEREKLRQYAALYREMAAQANAGKGLAEEQAAREAGAGKDEREFDKNLRRMATVKPSAEGKPRRKN